MHRKKQSLRVAEQINIPLALPIVKGNKDYKMYEELIETMDQVLTASDIEASLQEQRLIQIQQENNTELSIKQRLNIQRATSIALRCNIVRLLSRQAYRPLSVRLGESGILQKFCRLAEVDQVWIPSKSTLQEYAEMFEPTQIRHIVDELSRAVENEGQALGLKDNIDLSTVLMDTSCLELHIHYPVDWVLLKDAVRTLTLAIECIRRHGLKHRIADPATFRRKMNKHSMAMTHSQRKKAGRKLRRALLREMKKLSKTVGGHAERYKALLLARWQETDLTEGDMKQIIKRIDNVLEQLPEAIHQAHERIIGNRKVKNEDKILSLYQPQAQVYHRGKAGKRSEFGLQLLLAESRCGLITDWDLVRGVPKNDTKHVKPCLGRIKAAGIAVKTVVSDRGFHSQANSEELKSRKLEDHTCPRNVIKLKEKRQEKAFRAAQTRRAQTEARIGIAKHQFIGARLPAKGEELQHKHVALAVLSHNLWLIARKIMDQKKPMRKAA